jgi:histidyl-tRNA synthetase
VFGIIDKIARQPHEISVEKLAALGLDRGVIDQIFALMQLSSVGDLRRTYGHVDALSDRITELTRYFEYLERLDVAEWVTLDLSIVRGLAYYTGIVFELFDARGEFRAICGGGRYDTLLQSLGGADLPALGFGMGDVVLGELLRARGLMRGESTAPEFWVASDDPTLVPEVLSVATALRRGGASVEYALRAQQLGRQLRAANAAGAAQVVIVRAGYDATHELTLKSLASGDERRIRLGENGAIEPLT